MSYKLIVGSTSVLRIVDGAIIPQEVRNQDWLVYQTWIAAGNTPQAADPAPITSPRMVQDEQERTDCKADAPIMSLVNQTRAEWRSWSGLNFPTLTVAERTRLGDLFWVVAVGVRRLVRNGG